ncbi:MAG: hypothetical protein ACRC62_07570 [Microcoleus sp.]
MPTVTNPAVSGIRSTDPKTLLSTLNSQLFKDIFHAALPESMSSQQRSRTQQV